jgi:prolipoprotein diacylglyceryltransferase
VGIATLPLVYTVIPIAHIIVREDYDIKTPFDVTNYWKKLNIGISIGGGIIFVYLLTISISQIIS